MLLAIGVILLHVQAVPQAAIPAASQSEKVLLADASAVDETVPYEPGRLVLTPVATGAAAAASADPAPAAISPAVGPAIAPIRQTASAGRISNEQTKQWAALAIAQHGAAAFDAWTTRRAITQQGAHEMNPMLKPFANNSSIYAATQVAPVLLDMLGRRMMTSHNALLRHTWWLPQTLGMVASLSGGMNNLMVR